MPEYNEDAGLVDQVAEVIWATSRRDEGTISATGAKHVAQSVLNQFNVSLKGDPETLSVPQKAVNAVSKSLEETKNYVDPSYLYVVWSVKVLKNWKALVSTDVIRGAYWEVTFNGDTNETYVDEYYKKGQVIL